MADESTIASKLSDLATELNGVLTDINTALAGKTVTPADTLSDVADQIAVIETGTGITPSGTKNITENGTVDVTTYEYADVNVPTGTVKTAEDIAVSGNTVTVPAGLYAEQTTKTVSTATHPSPTVAFNTSTGQITATHTQSEGYVSAGTTTASVSIPTKGATTYIPNTSDQTISGYYLTGTQTIKGDTNLTASNIRNGVQIFNVTGSYGGGGIDRCLFNYSQTAQSSVTSTAMTLSSLNNDLDGDVIGMVIERLDQYTRSAGTVDLLIILPDSNGKFNAFIRDGDRKHKIIAHSNSIMSVSKGASSTTISIDISGISIDGYSASFYTSDYYYTRPIVA